MFGTVTNVRLARGFGFIKEPNSPRRYFFHCTDLSPDLDFDERLLDRRVKFLAVDGRDGRPRAVEVRPNDESDPPGSRQTNAKAPGRYEVPPRSACV